MEDRIKAAVDAKTDPDFIVMARTDALAVVGLDEVVERAARFEAAGADAIFAEAMTDLDMYTKVVEAVNVPVLFVQVRDDPISSADDIQAMLDNVREADNSIHWIDGTPVRHHGYTHFSTDPSALLSWLDAHRTAP